MASNYNILTRETIRFNNRVYSLFFLMGIFLMHLWLTEKWQDCKIFTKLVPSQTPSRSSHRRCSVKEGVVKNLQNFTGKHQRWSLFQIKLQAKVCNFIKRRLQHMCFPVKFRKFLTTPISKNIWERLLMPSSDLQNLIITFSSDFRGNIAFCIITS